MFVRVKYTVNVSNLVALVIQNIKWTISFVPILLLNKKKIQNFQFFQALGNFWKYFRKFLKISGNISKPENTNTFHGQRILLALPK